MASHFYLDDFSQSSEPLSDQPMPHTHVNPAQPFEADDEGYRGQPFPRPPRDSAASSPTAAATLGAWTPRRRCVWTASTRRSPQRWAAGCGSRASRPRRRPSPASASARGSTPREPLFGAWAAGSSGWTGRFAFRGRPRAWRPHPTRWPRRRSSAGPARWSHC